MSRRILVAALVGAFSISMACSGTPQGGGSQTGPGNQTANSNTGGNNASGQKTGDTAPPPIQPGSVQDLLAKQPDHKADVVVASDSSQVKVKIAKKGDHYRVEGPLPGVGPSIAFLNLGGTSVVLFPDKKQYFEVSGADQQASFQGPMTSVIDTLLKRREAKFELVGDETVDGHPAAKYKVTVEGQEGEVRLFLAKDLKNLLIRIEQTISGKTFSLSMTNASLDVTDADVQPPADYATTFTKITEDQLMRPAAPDADDAEATNAK